MTGPFFTVRMKKKGVEGLAGFMAGDALRAISTTALKFVAPAELFWKRWHVFLEN
jgi:hypothetical protein